MKFFVLSIFLSSTLHAECARYSPCIEIREDNQEKFISRETFLKKTTDEVVSLDLTTFAKGFIGTPYLYGGETSDGIDCSAFIQQVFSEYGIHLPRTSREQYRNSQLMDIDEKEIRPNDLLFFKSEENPDIDHVALYIGDGKMIHSSRIEKGVQITDFKFSKFWSSRFVSARRLHKEI